MHRYVIIGGGAGGLELATRPGDRLGFSQRAHVTLVDRKRTHIWKPLLHEVAAGSLDPSHQELAYAAQAAWHGFDFQLGDLVGLDRTGRKVIVGRVVDEEAGELLPRRELHYDSLVITIGSTTAFFGVKGAEANSIALDSVASAEIFRKRLISTCVRAQHGSLTPGDVDACQPRVQVAIVGAGATGVELSAELRKTAHVLSTYGLHKLDPKHGIGIVLIEAGPRILPALSERVSGATAFHLEKLGVRVMTGERVAEVSSEAIHTASGKVVQADLTVWAAGIKAPAVLAELDGLPANRIGQLHVRRTLQTTVDDNIFAIGDCAAWLWPGNENNVPPRAQAAHQQARFLVGALERRLGGRALAEYTYRDFGSLVSLGRFSAVGSLMGGLIGGSVLIEGLFARFMYRSLYRMHVVALHGYARMVTRTLAHWLRRSTVPRVKLH
ncbi:NADH dehydrogenase [Burkholderia sp. CF099]|nr:NADH dehydrogenase [Burkholderia sp. CF099]